jgi:hypothetical protein
MGKRLRHDLARRFRKALGPYQRSNEVLEGLLRDNPTGAYQAFARVVLIQ